MKFGLGQSVGRTEDLRFVTGQGQYTDDLHFPAETYAVFHRSPHAHARVKSINILGAKSAPGVVAVLTQEDVDKAGLGTLHSHIPVQSRDGSNTRVSAKPLLNNTKITFVGETVAMVIAETLAQAYDAAELIEVDYEPLDAAGTLGAAPLGAKIWDTAPDNQAFDWAVGEEERVDEVFAGAAHTVALEVVQNRVVPNSMETRNAIGIYDDLNDRYTLYTCSQGADGIRKAVCSTMTNLMPSQLRVVTRDVGGGFGMKYFCYPEQVLVLLAAKTVGRPVRWSADRTEAFLADIHGRDVRSKGELALDEDARILAMRITGTANLGGYLSQYAPLIPTVAGGRIFGGIYRVPLVFANVKGYFSNSAPVDAYRGAGRPEAAYLMERLMDVAAAKTGIDRIEIRARNLPFPEELPYTNWFGLTFDSGNYRYLLSEAVSRADVAGFGARREESEARGLKRGLGVAYYVEVTGGVESEPASVRFTDAGIEIFVGTQSTGQGHETAFAQVLAARLGVPFESIFVKQGDTNWVNSGGTGGSRSLYLSGAAIQAAADEVIRKGKQAVAQMLQARGSEVLFEITDGVGRFRVLEKQGGLSVGELAAMLQRERLTGFETGLDSDGVYDGPTSTFPNGCHICEVEVDPETGVVKLLSYKVLDDFGRVINPMLVAGQVHGGVAQGIGQALLENCQYEAATGQLLTASFSDYAMPRADDLPDIDFAFEEIVSKANPLGAKGCGEAGTVGAPPALVSAVCDAIGVVHLDMPLTPERVWRAVKRDNSI